MEYLKLRLKELMKPDSNMKSGSYLIRSVYFDDMHYSGLYANEDGADDREKFRIRTYDNLSDIIKLELKGKKSGYTSKESCLVDKEFVETCIKNGNNVCTDSIGNIKLSKDTNQLIKKLWTKNRLNLLHPVCIVEYERTAFIEALGNVRITFDKNIGMSNNVSSFFEDNIGAVPVLPKGQHILEVKYDEFLPEYIKEILDTGVVQKTAFSKYYYARTGIMNN